MKRFEIEFDKDGSKVLHGEVKIYEGRSCTEMKLIDTCQIEIGDNHTRLYPSVGKPHIFKLSEKEHTEVHDAARHYLAGVRREKRIYQWTNLDEK